MKHFRHSVTTNYKNVYFIQKVFLLLLRPWIFLMFLRVSFFDLDKYYEMLILEYILTTFEASLIFFVTVNVANLNVSWRNYNKTQGPESLRVSKILKVFLNCHKKGLKHFSQFILQFCKFKTVLLNRFREKLFL